jgi:hypothetical protein
VIVVVAAGVVGAGAVGVFNGAAAPGAGGGGAFKTSTAMVARRTMV